MESIRARIGITLLGMCVLGILIALVVGGSQGPSTTAVFTVCPSGCPYSSIQEAIDAAPPWSRIFIKEGLYKLPDGKGITITKDIILQGEDPEKTIIQGGVHPASGPYSIPITSIKDAHVVITGLTIKGGPPPRFGVYDPGILALGGAVVSIYNDRITCTNGSAIAAGDTAQVSIYDNIISGCSGAQDGILIANRAQANIHDNVLSGPGNEMWAIEIIQEAQAKIWRNSIHDNYAIGIQVGTVSYDVRDLPDDWEAGLSPLGFLAGMAQASIFENEIYNNSFEGIIIAGNGEADIFNNKIHHNGWAGVAVALTDPPAECTLPHLVVTYGYPFKGIVTGYANEIHDNGQGYSCNASPQDPFYSYECPPAPEGLDLCPPDYPWPKDFVKSW